MGQVSGVIGREVGVDGGAGEWGSRRGWWGSWAGKLAWNVGQLSRVVGRESGCSSESLPVLRSVEGAFRVIGKIL